MFAYQPSKIWALHVYVDYRCLKNFSQISIDFYDIQKRFVFYLLLMFDTPCYLHQNNSNVYTIISLFKLSGQNGSHNEYTLYFLLFDFLTITSGRSVEGGKDADVLIVGGGISGLAAADRLEKAGLKVTSAEASLQKQRGSAATQLPFRHNHDAIRYNTREGG